MEKRKNRVRTVTIETQRSTVAGWSREASLKKGQLNLIPKERRCGRSQTFQAKGTARVRP